MSDTPGLVPNSSAIVAIIEHIWVQQVESELAAEGAQVVHDTIKADIAAQLNAGGNVAYSVGVTDTGAAAVRTADSKDKTAMGGMVTTGDGVYVENATLTDEKLPSDASSEAKPSQPASVPADKSADKK